MSALLRALSAPSPVIERIALAIAEDAYPGLDIDACVRRLDEMVSPLESRLGPGAGMRERYEALIERVYTELRFCGNEQDYYDPRNSYFNEVIERRTGIPITLAVLLMALGRRVSLQVEGVGFPGHFLVRVGGEGGMYVDPFNEGRVIERDELLELARRFLGEHQHLAEAQLSPVTVNVMAVRMLFNLQQIYERRGDHARALVVCDRLVDISDAAFHYRDRGTHAMALGAQQAAEADLERYLELAPSAEDAAHVLGLLQQLSSGKGTSSGLN